MALSRSCASARTSPRCVPCYTDGRAWAAERRPQVSLPSVFLYPFSLLEVAGFRTLCHIDILCECVLLQREEAYNMGF